MVERPITFIHEGEQIVGILHEPEGGGKQPGVVMCHGFMGNKMESHRLFVHAARALAKVGFYVLRFDFRGSGDSEGNFIDMTVANEMSDAIAAWDWFMANTDVDVNRVALLGFSLGGCVAAYAASKVKPAALVLWSGVGEPLNVFTPRVGYDAMLVQTRSEGYLQMGGFQVGMGFVEELPGLNPLEPIASYTGPALFIHGTGDQSVPFENSHLFYRHAGSMDKELHLIEEADHTYSKIEWELALLEKTVEWVKKQLK